MIKVVVTGSGGFIGRNLMLALGRLEGLDLFGYDLGSNEDEFNQRLIEADIVYHLAGINRPKDISEFDKGNWGFLQTVLTVLQKAKRTPRIIITSSTQAAVDNPYGSSKKKAEEELQKFGKKNNAEIFIYRLSNVFGKWCRPFYNSVIATFCYQTARNEAIQIDDPGKVIDFVYVDDVVTELLKHLDPDKPKYLANTLYSVSPILSRSLGDIAASLTSFRESRVTAVIPDVADPFVKYLYSTYLSYLEPQEFVYSANKKSDERGYLFELLKHKSFGQIFISRTKPGITRGNHYHDTKVEKFCVLEGQARIAFRDLNSQKEIAFDVDGFECRVVDIPPGWTHNISNTGVGDLLTLFWANEPFDVEKADTYFEKV